ncbi:hypothetical protein SAMN03159444_04850 [Pseudomonas sp. NFACC02]|nr:hypothetical protein SAMN03159444_04850 [Pseudomonas sp. NFACC02]
MLVRILIKKILTGIVQLFFILALTLALGYCVLHLAIAQWLFNSWLGTGIHQWFLDNMGSKDLRDMLDCFTIMWLSMTPSIAVWICVLLTRNLRHRMNTPAPAPP